MVASCFLLTVWAATTVAASREGLDENALVQNKIHSRPDPTWKIRRLPVRAKLSREELLEVTKHLRLRPSDINGHRKDKKAHCPGCKEIVENVALKVCLAHFGGGLGVQEGLGTIATDLLIDEDMNRAVARSILYEGSFEIDSKSKSLQYTLLGVKSKRYQFIHPRFGCQEVNLLAWAGQKVLRDNSPRLPDSLPPVTEDAWKVAFAEATPLDQEVPDFLHDFFNINFIEESTVALVLHYKGKFYEKYLDSFGYTKDTKVLGYSMGKSVQGLLLGKLLDERGLDVRTTYSSMPELQRNKTAWGLTLQLLLNMAAGSPPKEETVRKFVGLAIDAASFAALTKDRLWDVAPGTWYYSTGYSFVVGRELRNIIGDEKVYFQFPWSTLFTAIGAESFMCQTDLMGNMLFGASCWATPRDWAKIGQLVLRHGVGPDGSQVIPRAWVDELWEGAGWHMNGFYINGWYRMDRLCFDDFGPILMAVGVGGQNTLVVKNLEVVIVRQSYTMAGGASWLYDVLDGCRGTLQFLLESDGEFTM